jgi:FkbM family methyltransferase
VWIFGAGQFGQDLCAALKRDGQLVLGFVETRPSNKQILELPVISWNQWTPLHNTESLCIGIFNRSMPLDELESLARQKGALDIYMPWDLYPVCEQYLGWRFWLSKPDLIICHLKDLARAMDCLSDESSKRCLIDIASFRLGLNPSFASFKHDEKQYFNSLTLNLLQGKSICFVDGGAFNGDTFLDLSSLIEIKESYLFEPDAENFLKLVTNVEICHQRVHCLPLGLSESYEILNFGAGNGEGASISDKGTSQIAVIDLDSVLSGCKIDFIKLDVEGAEMQALKGAKRVISDSRPVIAISLYHRSQDLWELPLAVFNLCKDYKFYIRQHFSNSFDSVLYAVPN